MAAEKITIAELDIDDKALVKSTADLKKIIDELNKSQKELVAGGNGASKAYVENTAVLKTLKKEYNESIKAISERTQATVDATNREKLLEVALNTSAETINDAREQTKLLTKLRNETNVSTTEGIAELAALNKKLDDNTEFVKENADGYLKLKLNIGNYKESIKEAFDEMNIFKGGFSELGTNIAAFNQKAKEAGGAGNLIGSAMSTAAKSLGGLTKASLAFIATPIGAIIAILAAGFLLVKNAMDRSEESTNKIKQAIAPLSGIFNLLLKALEPVGEFLIDGIVAGFDAVVKAASVARKLLASFLDTLGFDDAAEGVREFDRAINDAVEGAVNLAKAEAQLEAAQRNSRLTQLKYMKDAEKLRQVRDDESKSIKERIAANDELGKVLKEQLTEELKIAEQALLVANLRIEAEGKTKESLDRQAEALTEIADIQERITGQESEQLVNRISLFKEAAQKAKERAEATASALDLELEYFKESNRLTAESEQEKFDILQQASEKQLENLKFRFDKKLLTEQEYNLETLRVRNELTEAEDALDEAELARIQAFEDKKKELLDNIRILREEDEQAREELKIEIQFEKDTADIEKLIADETQRTELLALLTEERELVLQDIKEKYAEIGLEKFKEVLAKENEVAKSAGEAQIAIARTIYGALVGILGDSLAARLAAIAVDAALQVAQVQTTAAASSARNLAQATGAAPPPLNVPLIAAAVAQNTILATNAQVQTGKILTAAALRGLTTSLSKVKLRKGGIIGINGPSHERGGVPIYAGDQYVGEAEGDEGIGVLNKEAFSDFMGYNDSFNSGESGGGKYVGGGIITQAVKSSPENFDIVQGVSDALADMKIFVAVEDINDGQGNYASVVNEANLG